MTDHANRRRAKNKKSVETGRGRDALRNTLKGKPPKKTKTSAPRQRKRSRG